VKFNKSKCQILHLGQGNLGSTYKLGNKRLERSPAERDLGVWVDGKLNISQQCVLAARRASCVLGCIRHSMASQSRDATGLSHSVLQWHGPTFSTVCSFGHLNRRKRLSC